MRGLRNCSGALVCLTCLSISPPAQAYRPFDSTDPAVAAPGKFEIELSPLSFRRNDAGQTWITPQVRFNYGFAQNWEVVLEGQGEHPQYKGGRSALNENALSLKAVLREGSLQEKTGISIASEVGLLLPEWHGDTGTGAMAAFIAGQKFSWGAVHVNLAGALTREKRAELFAGAILEGPGSWTLRPVAEFVYERVYGGEEQLALLGGVIWQAKEDLAFDFALRQASLGGRPETEIRAGVTFAFSSK